MAVLNYKELTVWQKSMDLVVEIYNVAKLLPNEELYALSSQLRRAAVSVPSNIAEGQQRKSPKEFVNFLSIARGSIAELETQLLICKKLNYLSDKQISLPLSKCEEIGKMLNSLMNRIDEKSSK